MNIINALALNINGKKEAGLSSKFNATFKEENKVFEYEIEYSNKNVNYEELTINNKKKLHRDAEGKGKIWAEKIDEGREIDFHIENNLIAIPHRKDKLQHSFLEPIINWGNSVKYIHFGSSMGKEHYKHIASQSPKNLVDSNPNMIIDVFLLGCEKYNSQFKNSIIEDMGKINYAINKIDVCSPISIIFNNIEGSIVGLYVQEKGLQCITDQNSMSQGMFRALSLVIYLNYLIISGKNYCILIDDIGEGLDFNRSCKLANLVIQKTKNTKNQLIMTSNDQYIMNSIPLENWSLINRKNNIVKLINQKNQKNLFEDFRFTGLSNFSFFEMYSSNTDLEEKNTCDE